MYYDEKIPIFSVVLLNSVDESWIQGVIPREYAAKFSVVPEVIPTNKPILQAARSIKLSPEGREHFISRVLRTRCDFTNLPSGDSNASGPTSLEHRNTVHS